MAGQYPCSFRKDVYCMNITKHRYISDTIKILYHTILIFRFVKRYLSETSLSPGKNFRVCLIVPQANSFLVNSVFTMPMCEKKLSRKKKAS
ncbi:Protein of unknown function, partial [Gryllus bimaculatus]